MTLKGTETNAGRRAALRLIVTAPAAAILAQSQEACAAARKGPYAAPVTLRPRPELAEDARKLTFLRSGCRERFNGVYFAEGRYQAEALWEIDWRLRDVALEQCKPMDPKLLDLLAKIQSSCGGRELIVTSGYRTERTNQALRSRGAAKRSMHLRGQAVDFFCPGLSTKRLARLAVQEKAGGVGIYERKGFVHVDTGPIRYWKG